MRASRRHHFVPVVYLREWANDDDQVAVRRRGAATAFTPNVINVAVESGLYGSGEIAQAREDMFNQMEQQWPRLRQALKEHGGHVRGTDRQAVAVFAALQFVRTSEQGAQIRFLRELSESTGGAMPSREQVRDFLYKHVLRFVPDEHEVSAAYDLAAVAIRDGGLLTRDEELHLHFDRAIQVIGPHLERMSWIVEETSAPVLMTSDRPMMCWRPPSSRDTYEGVGLANADEVRFPLSPRHLLVLRTGGHDEGIVRVGKARFKRVNVGVASQCQSAIIGTSASKLDLEALRLADHRPAVRFSSGPGFRTTPDGSEQEIGDVLHMWTPTHV